LKTKGGINLRYVPYNSGTEAAIAVAGGQTQIGVASVDTAISLHRQGKLRIVAVSGPQRDRTVPDIPTLAELGFPEIQLDQMTGIFAPPGTPQDRINVLAAALQKSFADKDFIATAAKGGLALQPLGPAEFYKASQGLFATIKALESTLKPSR
jgi:tripartite-type tricarboxylate transporter receptor subunit TctC